MKPTTLHEAHYTHDRQRCLEKAFEDYTRAAKPFLDRMVELRKLYAGPAGDHEEFEMRWTNDAARLTYEQYEQGLLELMKLYRPEESRVETSAGRTEIPT